MYIQSKGDYSKQCISTSLPLAVLSLFWTAPQQCGCAQCTQHTTTPSPCSLTLIVVFGVRSPHSKNPKKLAILSLMHNICYMLWGLGGTLSSLHNWIVSNHTHVSHTLELSRAIKRHKSPSFWSQTAQGFITLTTNSSLNTWLGPLKRFCAVNIISKVASSQLYDIRSYHIIFHLKLRNS